MKLSGTYQLTRTLGGKQHYAYFADVDLVAQRRPITAHMAHDRELGLPPDSKANTPPDASM